MKTLALLVALVGCGSSVGTPDGAVPADAFVPVSPPDGLFQPADGLPGGQAMMTVSWNLLFVGSSQPVDCTDAGTPTVVLTVTPLGGAPLPTSAPCSSKSLTTPAVAPGNYDVSIELRSSNGVTVSSSMGNFTVQAGEVTDLGVVVLEVQSFQLAWTLQRGGQPISCADANATTVELNAQRMNEPQVTYAFPCTAGQGATPAIVLGTYLVGVKLRGTNGTVLWETQMPMIIPVDDRNRALLPPVVISL
jgi:hypothetical protein